MFRFFRVGFVTLACLVAPGAALAQGIITTVAGTTWIFRGDGGPAVNAPLGRIYGVAVDPLGNVYASDADNRLVVKITPAGVLSVVAGNGICGFSGDGGPGASASLCFPEGIALDTAGNLYIADTANNRIRKVAVDGTITTVAGNGIRAFSGDGGPATSATLKDPFGVAVDSAGNLYVADRSNFRVRKVSPSGVISTVAGNGTQGYSGDGGPAAGASLGDPTGLASDSAGNLYIADASNYRVRKVSVGGTITTVAGNGNQGPGGIGGPATSAGLSYPFGVALDTAGNFYVAELGNRVLKVSFSGIITVVAGTVTPGFSGDGGSATRALLNSPVGGIAVDTGGNLFVADTGNDRVRKVSAAGTIATIAGNGLYRFSGDGGPATGAALDRPNGIFLDAANNLFAPTIDGNRVRKVSSDGTITTLAGTGIGGFSGDGGPAANAWLNCPAGGTADLFGNLYIADSCNHRIRKVSVSGTITTVAGNGFEGLSGDGGPATAASLTFPNDLTFDAAGNLYIADTYNHAVRKIDFLGIIRTVAGNGVAGFGGDGGPAVNASLDFPQGVALDTAGNLYIADTYNHRIRKVSPNGAISTIAGNGCGTPTAGGGCFSGDGGMASSAGLNTPGRVAVDAAGNVYVMDGFNLRIRKVSPDGTIKTVAGGGVLGDGSPATNAFLNYPYGLAVDAAGNIYVSSFDRIRKVLASTPSFAVSPTSLSFSATAGVPGIVTQQITVSSTVTGLPWSALASTATNSGWLAISPGSGSTPGTISVGVSSAGLTPGTYQGTVTVQAAAASPSTQSIAVTLTVIAPQPVHMTVDPSTLSFQIPSGASSPTTQTLRISNGGSGTLQWAAQAGTTSGGSWLAVSPASGSASATVSAPLQVTANVAGLSAGIYSGLVTLTSSTTNETVSVPVTLSVTSQTQTILVSQSGLLFTAVEGGTVAPPQSFGVVNVGQGSMNWTASTATFTGGNWLSVLPGNGTSIANSLQVPLVQVAVNVSSLRAGQYSGQIRVDAPGANNSPQFVTIYLNVLPTGSNPGVVVRPTGLIFTALVGGTSPGSQTVGVATAASGSAQYISGLLTFGGNWLQAVPETGALSSSSPGTITAQPTLGTLAPGVYSGTLTLAFSDRSPSQVVSVLFLVVGQGTAVAEDRRNGEAATCVPQKLLAVDRALGSNFTSPVGWPSSIELQLTDDCANVVTNATVVASFSNGDPALTLASLNNGTYTGTWRPLNPASQVAVTMRAYLSPLTTAEVHAQGQVSGNPTVPVLFSGGVVNAASFAPGDSLAPGSIVSVFGRNLANAAGSSSLPLPVALGGASLNVAGREVPLFFTSNGQINAQLPFEIQPNSRPQIVVKAPGSPAVPETITISSAKAGIFTTNQQGNGQGAIINPSGALVDNGAPAAAGDVVEVFATGLGATNPTATSGQAAPNAEPLARVVANVTATVGGKPAAVSFSGLAPGFVGLYQVNVQVPAGLATGAEPLVLLVNGVPSNTVTLVLR